MSESINMILSDNTVTLDDIFISVKTSGKYHKSRLSSILDTWFSLAPSGSKSPAFSRTLAQWVNFEFGGVLTFVWSHSLLLPLVPRQRRPYL